MEKGISPESPGIQELAELIDQDAGSSENRDRKRAGNKPALWKSKKSSMGIFPRFRYSTTCLVMKATGWLYHLKPIFPESKKRDIEGVIRCLFKKAQKNCDSTGWH